MALETKITASIKPALQYADLKPGDVFAWGNGTSWYLKTKDGYTCVTGPSPHITDEYIRLYHGSAPKYPNLRLAKKATLLIEE